MDLKIYKLCMLVCAAGYSSEDNKEFAPIINSEIPDRPGKVKQLLQ